MPGAIDIGFVPDWKQGGTLLFVSDAKALSLLEASLTSLAMSKRDEVRLHELPFVRVHYGVAINAQCVAVDSGISREVATAIFRWVRSPAGWAAVISQIRGLIDSGPGHHAYLDGPFDEVVVELSVGEYSDDVWQRQA